MDPRRLFPPISRGTRRGTTRVLPCSALIGARGSAPRSCHLPVCKSGPLYPFKVRTAMLECRDAVQGRANDRGRHATDRDARKRALGRM